MPEQDIYSAAVVENLVVHRGGQPVLRGLSFRVEPGTVTGLLGPSGCGKTTLIRSIVGVQRIRSGTVTVLGEPAGSPRLRREVGYVTQAPSVYEDLTIRQNVRYFGAVCGATARAADATVEAVGLASLATALVGRLSGGQRARVSLACSLVGDPTVLVLDEPTVGLDPVLRRDLWQRFHALAAGGTTLIVSSHVMDEAQRCDRLLLLREGELLCDDTPANVAESMGTDSLDEAFLRMVLSAEEEVAR